MCDCLSVGDLTDGLVREETSYLHRNVTEIVQTYTTYLKWASLSLLQAGAKVVISSPTSDDPWATGTFSYVPNRFTYFSWYIHTLSLRQSSSHSMLILTSRLAASELGGLEVGVYWVDHGSYAAVAMDNLGNATVRANYPLDHTHTAPYLSRVVAQSYVLGLKCGTSGLMDLVANASSRIEGPLLGTCLLANSTLPIRWIGKDDRAGVLMAFSHEKTEEWLLLLLPLLPLSSIAEAIIYHGI